VTRAPARAVDRQRWAVEAMAVAPGDRVLEIGCGAGAATALVAERLRTGRVVAVDRSASAVRRALERNAAHIRAGTADVRHADVTAADLPDGAFDKVFAVNVSLFWLATPPELLDRLRRFLAPDGSLYVFAERPTRTAVEAIATTVTGALRGQGFGTVTATVSDSRAAVVAS
jgi:ubiquinone/menaquinone biosynthesis C-methylase UbiE